MVERCFLEKCIFDLTKQQDGCRLHVGEENHGRHGVAMVSLAMWCGGDRGNDHGAKVMWNDSFLAPIETGLFLYMIPWYITARQTTFIFSDESHDLSSWNVRRCCHQFLGVVTSLSKG